RGISQMHCDIVSENRGLRLDLQFITDVKDQQTALSTRVLDGRAHDSLDEFFQNHFARDCLGDFDYGRQIQELRRRHDRAGRAPSWLLLPELGIELVELPYFAVSSPAEIAIPGLPQICIRDLVEASRRKEAGGKLARNRLIVNESVFVRRAHGLFIKTFGIEQAALY